MIAASAAIAGAGWHYYQSQQIALLDEPPVSLTALRSDWLVVNYFAEWCRPCLKELPELAALAQDPSYANVNVLTVNFDQSLPSELRNLRDKFKAYASIVVDYEKIHQLAPPPAQLPVTYIYAPGGKLIKTLWGEQSRDSIVEAMRLPE